MKEEMTKISGIMAKHQRKKKWRINSIMKIKLMAKIIENIEENIIEAKGIKWHQHHHRKRRNNRNEEIIENENILSLSASSQHHRRNIGESENRERK